MRTEHVSMWTLVAGLALPGCGNVEPSNPGEGNGGTRSVGGTQGAGGTTTSSGGFGTGGAAPSLGGAPTTGGANSGNGGTNAANGGTNPANGGSANGGTASMAGGAASAGATAGGSASGGSANGGASAKGGATAGGRTSGGGANGGSANGGNSATGGKSGSGGANSGTCTASKTSGSKMSGTGSHQVVVETNSDAGIKEGTIYRPADLGGTEKYPIFVWGEGGCSLNGSSNSAAMAEIASHGYFVVADGTPNGSGSRNMDSSNPAAMGKPLLAYVTWAIAENDKPCSAYYQSLNTTKVAANGFSCGGLMAEGTAGDARITTWGINSSGLFGANQAFYKTIHTPVLIVLGGSGDIAYENGERDFDNISALGIPTLLFSKQLGHGGDLFSRNGGDFTKIDLAWLNWHLKGDETATGKGLLVGSGCTYCKDSAWEVKSKNVQ